jgi:hypothetical protein
MRLEGLRKLKKFSDLIGTGTRGLVGCSIMPQPMTNEINTDDRNNKEKGDDINTG